VLGRFDTGGQGLSSSLPVKSGLFQWIDPSSAYVVQTGNNITSVTDRSGNGNNLVTTSGTKPTWTKNDALYNNKGTIHFNGNSFMDCTFTSSAVLPWTKLIVWNQVSVVSNATFLDTPDASNIADIIIASSSSVLIWYPTYPNSMTTNQPHYTNTSPSTILNQAGVTSGTCLWRTNGSATGVSGVCAASTTQPKMRMGCHQNGSLFSNAICAQYIVWSRILTAGEIAAVEAWGRKRWATW
jgi:hypothetical protein